MFTLRVIHELKAPHCDEDKLNKILHNQSIIMGQFDAIQTTLSDINTSLTTIQNNAANGLTADQTAQVVSALQTVASTLSAIANPTPVQP